LTFARAGEPVTVPLALEEVVRGSMQLALSGSNVSCDLSVPGDLWPILGDERQIAQVIDNLLLNARQAMPRGGRVAVEMSNVVVPRDLRVHVKPGRYVCVSVRDKGPGIPAELRSRVFEPFFTTKPSGSGLGLTTCYSIVNRHHGCIDLCSEPDSGTTFRVCLPAATEIAQIDPDSASEPSEGGAGGRILIMDDEDYVREVLGDMLRDLGYAVEAVADGNAAVDAFEAASVRGEAFDLVILDLTIVGGAGGVATLPRLRAIDPSVTAIAASGYSADPIMADPQPAGFAGTLPKPFTMGEVAKVVSSTMPKTLSRGQV
jgi:CheY-like chemotaxis protein